MASFCFKNAYVSLGGTDLSAYVKEVNINGTVEILDDTAMGDNSKNKLPGLKDGKFSVTFNDDLGASGPDATLWAIWNNNVAVAFIIKPNGASTSSTNPKYTGNCILADMPFVNGSVGQLATRQSSFEVTGDIARATSD